MSIIDERGRAFGRFNLIDAAALLLVVLMVPVAYGAYVLLRNPTPQLADIMPAVINQAPGLQARIHGANLRPYMRVSFGTAQGRGFYFGSPETAVVDLPELAPGKYDVVLYDYAQEVSRLKDALTVNPAQQPPRITVKVGGTFTGLTEDQASKLTPNHHLPEVGMPVATILEVDSPRQSGALVRAGDASLVILQQGQREVPATLSLNCNLAPGNDGILRCAVGGVQLAPDVNINLPGLNTVLNFRISDVHVPGESVTATVRARFLPRPGVRESVAVGDRDIGAKAFPTGVMATVASIASGPDPASIDLVLRVHLDQTPTGWTYKSRPVKAGALITFETLRYTMDGTITGVELPGAGK